MLKELRIDLTANFSNLRRPAIHRELEDDDCVSIEQTPENGIPFPGNRI